MPSPKYNIEITLQCYEYPEWKERHFIDLYELWQKAQYSVPFHRWLRYTLKNYGFRVRRVKRKREGAGRPVTIAYLAIEDSSDLLDRICRKRGIIICLGDMKLNGKNGDKERESSSFLKLLRRPIYSGRHLKLVRE